jgi:hypothetical protein
MAEDKERKRQREYCNANRKRAIINRYKCMRGCCDCGYKEHAAALEFDHLDASTKTRTVASLMYNSMERIKQEIAKCVVRCANCHQIKSVIEAQQRSRYAHLVEQ